MLNLTLNDIKIALNCNISPDKRDAIMTQIQMIIHYNNQHDEDVKSINLIKQGLKPTFHEQI